MDQVKKFSLTLIKEQFDSIDKIVKAQGKVSSGSYHHLLWQGNRDKDRNSMYIYLTEGFTYYKMNMITQEELQNMISMITSLDPGSSNLGLMTFKHYHKEKKKNLELYEETLFNSKEEFFDVVRKSELISKKLSDDGIRIDRSRI